MSDEAKRNLGRGLMRAYLDLKALTSEYERTLQHEIIHTESDARLLRMRHAMQIAVNKLREGLDPSLTEGAAGENLGRGLAGSVEARPVALTAEERRDLIELGGRPAEVTKLLRLYDAANGTNARWMAATGCATPEAWEASDGQFRACLETYARGLMGDANDSCMSEPIGQELLELLGEPNHGG